MGDKTISRNVEEDVAFMLGNKKGGYVYFSTGKKSRYEGVFLQLNKRMYRVIAYIGLEKKPDKIVNRFHSVERHVNENRERFMMPYNLNSIVYELEKADWINISLDVRESYDTSAPGSYEILEKDKAVIVKCSKDGKESFVSIKAERPKYELLGEFNTDYNERDMERNSPPYEIIVHKTLRVRSKKLAVAFSDDMETAVNESTHVLKNLKRIKEEQENHVKDLIKKEAVGSDETWMAYNCCINSLDQLTCPDGIVAGFPWFFQPWTRDELVSVKKVRSDLGKRILLKNLGYIMDDGRIPNMLSNTEVVNADSIGWLFKRIDESLPMFNKKERNLLKEKLIESIMRLNETHVKDLLVYNKRGETWMDSSYDDNGREGARIEIQALTVCMYGMAYRLTHNEKFLQLKRFLIEKVRQRFWDGGYLKDGSDDPTIRPNAFIAAYLCPTILTMDEWATCFEMILPRLWCEWGGLSSIDRKHPLYTERSTGEDTKSYHRGDSWYFLNNMAALVLHRIDRKRFLKYIGDIAEASTEDILWKGMIGHHSEISSAAEQKAEGCGAQAWSAALYLEMIDELFLN